MRVQAVLSPPLGLTYRLAPFLEQWVLPFFFSFQRTRRRRGARRGGRVVKIFKIVSRARQKYPKFQTDFRHPECCILTFCRHLSDEQNLRHGRVKRRSPRENNCHRAAPFNEPGHMATIGWGGLPSNKCPKYSQNS